jgi:cephalosporin-C deacetylase-like acetyl esterase
VVVKFIGYGSGRGLPAEHMLLPALGYALLVMDTRDQGGRWTYTEVPEFLAHQVDLVPAALDTLRYVDCALLARRITAHCLLSVGLMDIICPPSTVSPRTTRSPRARTSRFTRSPATRCPRRTSSGNCAICGSSAPSSVSPERARRTSRRAAA